MKKIVLFIIILMIGLSSVSAQSTNYEEQKQQILNDLLAGNISEAVYNERMSEIYQKIQEELPRAIEEARRINEEARQRGQEMGRKVIQSLEDSGLDTSHITVPQSVLTKMDNLMDQTMALWAALHDKKISESDAKQQAGLLLAERDRVWAPYKGNLSATNQLQEAYDKGVNWHWPGAQQGWPPMDGPHGVMTITGFGPFRQGSDTKASYTADINFLSYSIFQGNADQADYDDLRRQIEQLTGKRMELDSDGNHRVRVPNKLYPSNPGYNLRISLGKGRLGFAIAMLHF
jgi:hypothetical protein